MDELEFPKREFPKTEFISDSNKSVFENSTGLSEIFVLFLFLFSTSDFSFGFTGVYSSSSEFEDTTIMTLRFGTKSSPPFPF